MIYTVSEWLATISESLIIFFFLVKILSYKNMTQSKKIIGTIIFCCLQCTSSLVLDQFFVFEGLYVIITIFIYFLPDNVKKAHMVSDNCCTPYICLPVHNQYCCNIDCRFNTAKYYIRCAIFEKSCSYLAFIYYKSDAGFCIDHSY